MVQGPGIGAPFDWTIAQDIFPQPPQNIAIEVFIHSLSWWKNSLCMMHDDKK
jgi:hypothetical protein